MIKLTTTLGLMVAIGILVYVFVGSAPGWLHPAFASVTLLWSLYVLWRMKPVKAPEKKTHGHTDEWWQGYNEARDMDAQGAPKGKIEHDLLANSFYSGKFKAGVRRFLSTHDLSDLEIEK